MAVAVVTILMLLGAAASADGDTTATAFFTDPEFPFRLIARDSYEPIGASRSPFAVHVVFLSGCDPCSQLLVTARSASRLVAQAQTGASLFAINASDRPTLITEGELGQAIAELTTYPAIFVTHFGRVDTKIGRLPHSDADELANFIITMTKPPSQEIKTEAELLHIIESNRHKMTIVVGYYTSGKSIYRLREIAENFRGLVNFYHVSPHLVGATDYTETLVVYKFRGRDPSLDPFVKHRAGPRRGRPEKPSFDPLSADDVFGAPASTTAEPRLAPVLTPSELRAGGATAWYSSPVVDFAAAHADDGCASGCPLETRNRTEVLRFLSRVAFPPVDVLTVRNRDHYNVRTPNLVIMFLNAVSAAEGMRKRQAVGARIYTLHDERAIVLREASAQLRYLMSRLEALSDEFPTFTFLLAGYDDNMQVFSQFGFALDEYEKGSTRQIGAVSGPRKYIYPEPVFLPDTMRRWLSDILNGTAPSFQKSSTAPTTDPEPGTGHLGLVTFNTIHRVTASDQHDAVVYFAHEMRYSERTLKGLEQLAADEKDNTRIVFVGFDGLDNDPPESFEFEALPALYFVRAGGNATPLAERVEQYRGDFSLESIARFVRQRAKWPLRTSRGFSGTAPRESSSPPTAPNVDKGTATQEKKKGGSAASGSRTIHMKDGKVIDDL